MEARYRPENAPTIVSLEKEFRECYLREGRDPSNWITVLQTFAMNMNRIIVAGKSDMTPQDIAIYIADQKNTKLQLRRLRKY